MASDFLGRGWSFPPRFSRDGGAEMVSAEQDIRESLVVLFSTMRGERVMLPTFGSDLPTLVFENIDAALVLRARHMVRDAILHWEPRIVVQERDIEVGTDPGEPGLVTIKVEYTVAQTNARSNIVFPFYQAEGTNVRPLGEG